VIFDVGKFNATRCISNPRRSSPDGDAQFAAIREDQADGMRDAIFEHVPDSIFNPRGPVAHPYIELEFRGFKMCLDRCYLAAGDLEQGRLTADLPVIIADLFQYTLGSRSPAADISQIPRDLFQRVGPISP
jgi:hypothetical protein